MSTTVMLKPIDNHDLDDRLMYLEKVFGIDVPDEDASDFLSQEGAVRWIVEHLPRPPNVFALALLCRSAESQQRPGLAEGREWRSEQIAAIISDIFTKQRLMKSSPYLAEYIWLDQPSERPGKARWRKFVPTRASVLLFATIAVFILLWRQLLR
ncbi:MAG: hypothetical protein WBD45_11010 [Terriglobales bacterium]